MSIARVCAPHCEWLLGALALLVMLLLFVGMLVFVYVQRSRQAARDRRMDVERERQLEDYRREKGSATTAAGRASKATRDRSSQGPC